MRTRIGFLGLTLAVLLMTACTSEPAEKPATGPIFETVACPDDVEVQIVPPHACGYVRPDPDGPHRLFVVTVEPPAATDASPVLETGTDLGMTPSYGGLAPIAQRTGRRLVIVDLPGTGHSTPSMDCPEVEALGDPAAGHDIVGLADAVQACRERVEASGLDPASLTPTKLGDALFAVMSALDVPGWVVMGHGTTAEAGRQVALAHPDRVEALVLDSTVADEDLDAGVERVVADVARACRADGRCVRQYGDPARTWAKSRRHLAEEPIKIDVADTTVTIDADTLARGVRWLTAPASFGPGLLPALLAEAAAGAPGPNLQLLADTLAAAPPLCVGLLPKCESEERLAIGAVLSALCPTFADQDAWSAACDAWGVPPATEDATPLDHIPTLALYGAYDPYASPEAIAAAVRQRIPDAFLAEYAAGGHNVLGYECPRAVRSTWLAGDVHDPPPDDPCMSDPIDFQS